jgi:5-methyltetrahydrofolate--homocysteine methyltransferase
MGIHDISLAILAFEAEKVPQLVQAELDAGTDIATILNGGLISAMDEVGKRFSEGHLYVPEMLKAAQVMKSGLEILKPHLAGQTGRTRGTIVIGTVKGDLHDIGKNLVAMMLEGAGFNVVDLGADVAAEKFVEAAKEQNANIVALSALLTTTMPAMQVTISALKESGLEVKIMIGGAPVTQSFGSQIGADGYGDDAPSAVVLARKFMS